jgi:hypothetical protein
MDMFLLVYSVALVFALSFLGWLYTKSGKKWLKSL